MNTSKLLLKVTQGWGGGSAAKSACALARHQRLVPSTHTWGRAELTAYKSMQSMLLTAATTRTHGHIASHRQIQTHTY